MQRIVCLVADGLGVGEAPDAAKYGDTGSNTLGNLAREVGGLRLPNLQRLGLGNLGNFSGIPSTRSPQGVVARLNEKSEGKDTTTGHWEIAGLVTREPFRLFPEGFPSELLEMFICEAELPGVLANKPASGTTILDECAQESIQTGRPIVYTSGDSVFQIAAHETHFGLERLYRICEIARRLTLPFQIGRVIARPFVGEKKGAFQRTENRRDYVVDPGENCLDLLSRNHVKVLSVGKIEDIFNHRAISAGNHTGNNADSLGATLEFLKGSQGEKAFIFTNLVDFDMLYGHRRDAKGYAGALVELDAALPAILAELTCEDLLLLTADHGCDPTFRGTDHTREYVPMVAYRPGITGKFLGDRDSFADIASTVLDAYGIAPGKIAEAGTSFLCSLKN